MDNFISGLQQATDYHYTENGALSHSTTNKAVYDLFAFGAAYRQRSDEDCIFLFQKAFEEDEALAMKCLFWIRDARGGAGERRFFRVCYHWLAINHTQAAARNMQYLPEFGRVDDLYCLDGTPLEDKMYEYLKTLVVDAIEEIKSVKEESDGSI